MLAFAIFNTYMLLWSTQVNIAVFAVFFTLEATEIILFIGNFAANSNVVKIGGYVGVVTAAAAWYTSAAGVINGMRGSALLPVGKPFGMSPSLGHLTPRPAHWDVRLVQARQCAGTSRTIPNDGHAAH